MELQEAPQGGIFRLCLGNNSSSFAFHFLSAFAAGDAAQQPPPKLLLLAQWLTLGLGRMSAINIKTFERSVFMQNRGKLQE
jgi:hypothetical protein